LRKATLEYLRPARVDDLIEVHTACTALTGARMNADQKICLNGQLLTRGAVEACVITLSGKPRRIPEEFRQKLLPLLLETKA
jgi:acyl-CoA thioester hydrolase